MRVLLVGAPTSAHIIRWANALVGQGITVGVFGMGSFPREQYHPAISLFEYSIDNSLTSKSIGSFQKLSYLKALLQLKQAIRTFSPDILHSHLATSYGLLGSLTGFTPFIVSVWGYDVFSFPEVSFLHRSMLKFVLERATTVFSTSNFMAERTKRYTNTPISVTPFGIDCDIFSPCNKTLSNTLTLGMVKNLEKWYGIETAIETLAYLKTLESPYQFKLLLVGEGSMKSFFQDLVKNLNLENCVEFVGKVPYSEVHKYHKKIDIYLGISTYNDESFGVSLLEAQACGTPVIATKMGGLPEVVLENKTGIFVEPKNPFQTADAIMKIISSPEIYSDFSGSAREFVLQQYSIEKTTSIMFGLYNEVLKK